MTIFEFSEYNAIEIPCIITKLIRTISHFTDKKWPSDQLLENCWRCGHSGVQIIRSDT